MAFRSLDTDNCHLWPFFHEELVNRLENTLARCFTVQQSCFASIAAEGLTPCEFSVEKLQFIPFSSDSLDNDTGSGSYRAANLHISLIACDDMDNYKSMILAPVSSWLDAIHAKKDQHSLLIQITSTRRSNRIEGPSNVGRYDLESPHGANTSRADLVFEQMDTDFVGFSNNQIIQLRLRDKKDLSWETFISKFSELLFISFWSSVNSAYSKAKSFEEQEKTPEWSYCKWLTLIEHVSFLLISAKLYDHCSHLYERAYEMLKKQINNSVEQSIAIRSDSQALNLNFVKKILKDEEGGKYLAELHSSIQNNNITFLDLYFYLCYREVSTVMYSSHPDNVYNSIIKFLTLSEAMTNARWKLEFLILFFRGVPPTLAKSPNVKMLYWVLKRLLSQSLLNDDDSPLGYSPQSLLSITNKERSTSATESFYDELEKSDKLLEDRPWRINLLKILMKEMLEFATGREKGLLNHEYIFLLGKSIDSKGINNIIETGWPLLEFLFTLLCLNACEETPLNVASHNDSFKVASISTLYRIVPVLRSLAGNNGASYQLHLTGPPIYWDLRWIEEDSNFEFVFLDSDGLPIESIEVTLMGNDGLLRIFGNRYVERSDSRAWILSTGTSIAPGTYKVLGFALLLLPLHVSYTFQERHSVDISQNRFTHILDAKMEWPPVLDMSKMVLIVRIINNSKAATPLIRMSLSISNTKLRLWNGDSEFSDTIETSIPPLKPNSDTTIEIQFQEWLSEFILAARLRCKEFILKKEFRVHAPLLLEATQRAPHENISSFDITLGNTSDGPFKLLLSRGNAALELYSQNYALLPLVPWRILSTRDNEFWSFEGQGKTARITVSAMMPRPGKNHVTVRTKANFNHLNFSEYKFHLKLLDKFCDNQRKCPVNINGHNLWLLMGKEVLIAKHEEQCVIKIAICPLGPGLQSFPKIKIGDTAAKCTQVNERGQNCSSTILIQTLNWSRTFVW